MKINCVFCGTAFNDTQEQCPHCGAPNSGIVRTANDQPITIDQLKQWYKERGLPPAEVTRFFIGVDYKEPRAFGIYKDENTGVCTVYKNKDNGERAIRYEGTDEAYAVNELYQRLKQEIIQQKMNDVKKNSSSKTVSSSSESDASNTKFKVGGVFKTILGAFALWGLTLLGGLAVLVIVGIYIMMTLPKQGYYKYEGDIYYYCSKDYADYAYYSYYKLENGEWTGAFYRDDMPEKLQKRSKAKKLLVSKTWSEDLNIPNFDESVFADDMNHGFNILTGYYEVDGVVYYNLYSWFDTGWYVYDADWAVVEYDDLPFGLKHTSVVDEYFVADSYNSSIGAYDFADSLCYRDSQASTDLSTGYYSCDNREFYHIETDYSSGWYEYSSSDWSSVDYGDLPDDMKHNSIVEDFYYTPTWDATTQISDFTSSYAYEEYVDSHSSSSSDDSDYDWGGSDSWDSGSTDFSSDW